MNWAKYAGFIVLAYIVFTTVKGNLRKWLQIIGLKPDDVTQSATSSRFDDMATARGLTPDQTSTVKSYLLDMGVKF